MQNTLIKQYFSEILEKWKTGQAREHAYRPVFEKLITFLDPSLKIINDPSRSEHGNPDFIFLRGDTTAGYAETKDIGLDLDKVEKSKQIERYFGYSNLILTDYVEFRFFRNGEHYGDHIRIAEIKDGNLISNESNFGLLANALADFFTGEPEPIRKGKRLAEIMGGKARRIRDNINLYFKGDSERNNELKRIYDTIKKLLIHDLTPEAFADLYAQTLVYGLFVARYYDDTPDNFTRGEARELIPKSNPLLRHFFDHIVGPDFDKRLEYIVNELCGVFSRANVPELMRQYFKNDLWGEIHEGPDPVIHFYEDFLKEYDADLRKKIGAFYTPLPIVRFIVRAVDHVLEKEFGLSQGLADTSKTEDIHRVQILDPAVGTGTFLTEVVRNIYLRFTDQKGRWPTYVHHDLLPRLHGFELMMAPYTIAHLKLGIVLKETGFKHFNNIRLGIYLTNSLEASVVQKGLFTTFGFAESIAEESKEASVIKNKTPIMVVIGNPPYSISSLNKGEWIQNLIKNYKKNLGERKVNLDDDYIKFIRFAEHFIEKNKNGIVAMITNNSFIDGITHRQMRKHLLETFDNIYIIDLHGNSKKKEKAPDGGKDENVFDIQQGVSINIFVRTGKKKTGLGVVHHTEFYGKREDKFKALNRSDLKNVKWKRLDYSEPYYFFVPKDFGANKEYERGFKVNESFCVYSSGIESAKDNFIIKFSNKEILDLKNFIEVHSDKEIADRYHLKIEKATQVKNDFTNIIGDDTKLLYRPFDIRYTLYSSNSQGVWFRPKYEVMKHLVKDNLALLTCRQQTSFGFQHIFIASAIVERCAVSLQTGEVSYAFPLYLYAEDGSKISNLKKEIVDEIQKIVGKVSPEDVFDYIYAALHSPNYRKKYKEFLKIDFPRVPYPKDAKSFKEFTALGAKLCSLHLLEDLKVNKFITIYPEAGDNIVEKASYTKGKVFINKTQYFGGVPEIAWNFYIGGYQPAQKWLKDRKGRTLTNSEIEHYQKMIVALVETEEIIKEIDKI
jgi:predicted helicase